MRLLQATWRLLSAAIVALSLGAFVQEQSAQACSCVQPRLAMITTDVSDAALNSHVRLEVPHGRGSYLLRAHRGPDVPTKVLVLPGRWVDMIDLEPLTKLRSETRYEVAIDDPTVHPRTTVVGTFKTGALVDTTPPVLTSLGKRQTHLLGVGPQRGMCSVAGPWVTFAGIVANDPGRPAAELLYAVWAVDRAGSSVFERPPLALLQAEKGEITLGQTSACDPRGVPLTGTSAKWYIVAIDEAGNRSLPKLVEVDLSRPSR